MRSKLLLSAVISVAVLGMALPAGAATPINGTGTVSCHITGIIKFIPPLTEPATGGGSYTLKAKLTNCTGTGDGAHVVSGSAKGSATSATHSCSGASGTSHNTLTSTVKWKVTKGSAKLNPTTVTYTTEAGGVSGNSISFTASGSATGGSFNGKNASASASIQETATTFLTNCGKKGQKTLHIVAPSSASLS